MTTWAARRSERRTGAVRPPSPSPSPSSLSKAPFPNSIGWSPRMPRQSVALEPDCLRFDVLTPADASAADACLPLRDLPRPRGLRPASRLGPFPQFDQRSRDLVREQDRVRLHSRGERQGCDSDMSGDVSALDLFGTDEPIARPPALTRRPAAARSSKTAICARSALPASRSVRAINYLARDASWGTYKAVPSNLEIIESDSAFTVDLRRALLRARTAASPTRMTITGEASGRLTMEAVGEALTDFPTNRTGFVVLHPSEAAGGRLTIRHSDGEHRRNRLSRSDQPRPAGLRHFRPHARARARRLLHRRDGRRRLRDGGPAQLGRRLVQDLYAPAVQAAALCHRQGRKRIASGSPSRSRLRPRPSQQQRPRMPGWFSDAPAGRMPSMALFLDPDELPAALANAASLGTAQDVIVRFDAERGHDWRTLDAGRRLCQVDRRAAGDRGDFQRRRSASRGDASSSTRSNRQMSSRAPCLFHRAANSRRGRRTCCRQAKATIGELVDALRAAGLKASIGAGTPSFFTEFNRNPPTGDGDFVFFSVASNVHAADDLSVMETLSVYPAVIASARKLCPGKPLWLGPCTIGMRHNPYGADVAANPAACPLAGGRRRPAAWRAVRRSLRRRRGRAGGRSRRRPLDPGRADRPLWIGDRRRRPSPAAGGLCRARGRSGRRALCRGDRSAGPGSRRLPRRSCRSDAACQPDATPRWRSLAQTGCARLACSTRQPPGRRQREARYCWVLIGRCCFPRLTASVPDNRWKRSFISNRSATGKCTVKKSRF